jgi:hypothetical protein
VCSQNRKKGERRKSKTPGEKAPVGKWRVKYVSAGEVYDTLTRKNKEAPSAKEGERDQ